MTGRRYDLDWLRIIAFGLLILYHIGLFFSNWTWHVNSSHRVIALEPLLMLTNPWRLALLFLISGAAMRFMADKLSAWEFAKSRLLRLVPPLLFGIFVIVPPQAYYETVEALQRAPTPEAAAHYQAVLNGFYPHFLRTLPMNHMWFVWFLVLYTITLFVLLPVLRLLGGVAQRAAGVLNGPMLIFVPWLVLFAFRFTLLPIFGESHQTPWYLHSLYFGMFLFGFAVAKYEPFFEACARQRRGALWLALGSWLVWVGYFYAHAGGLLPPGFPRGLMQSVYCLQAWCAILAAIGYAHQYLRDADGPARRLLTEAVFPFYIAHQTIIVVAGHYLEELRLPLAAEAPLLIGITVAGCWLFFDLGRRIPILRPWIGLASNRFRSGARGKELVAGEAH